MKRFSKSILLTILVLSMVFIFVGCKSAKVEAEEPIAVAEPAKPAEPAEPAKPAEPAEPAEPAKAEEPAPVSGVSKTYTIAGYEIKVDAEVGKAVVTYPTELITEADLANALTYVQANYAAYLEGITYDYKPGTITLYYPASLTADDFAAVEKLASAYVEKAIEAYGNYQVATATVETPSIDYELSYAGYKATVSFKDNVAIITYPSIISNKEVMDAASAAYAAYGAFLQGTTLVVDNGSAVLTFPAKLAEADIDAAMAVLQKELPTYVKALTAGTPVETAVATAEPVAVTATSTPATSAAEAAVPAGTPATTPVAATPAAKPATPAATPAAEPAKAAKKSSAGLIIVIIVLVLAACAACFIILKKKKK